MNNKIHILMDTNEKGSGRDKALASVAGDDPRFELDGFAELPVDLCFTLEEKSLQCEVKECSDYIQSALGKDGHLFLQYLAMEKTYGMILVLGGDEQVSEAIRTSLWKRYKGKELAFNISQYESRLIDFEANAEALGCPVERWHNQPWKRLLSRADKLLNGGSLLGYRPRPEGERDIAALCVLVPNVGPTRAKSLIDAYGSFGAFVSALQYEKLHGNEIKALCEVDGIGPKTAKAIAEAI